MVRIDSRTLSSTVRAREEVVVIVAAFRTLTSQMTGEGTRITRGTRTTWETMRIITILITTTDSRTSDSSEGMTRVPKIITIWLEEVVVEEEVAEETEEGEAQVVVDLITIEIKTLGNPIPIITTTIDGTTVAQEFEVEEEGGVEGAGVEEEVE